MTSTKQKHILLVEDDTASAEITIFKLEQAGYKGTTTSTGEEAIRKVINEQNIVDIILMDVNLGESLDGIEIAREILKIVNIPIIFLSSTLDIDTLRKTENLASYGYHLKSTDFTALITSIKMALKLHEANIKIEKLLTEKELLLKEVHHRIKNNMSSVVAMLSLQAYSTNRDDVKNALNEASGRVLTMMHLYDRLYRSETLSILSGKDYLLALLKSISEIYAKSDIQIKYDISDVQLDPKVLSQIGIIINELITNSIKYAFVDKTKGYITLQVKPSGNDLLIVYKDNGSGIPSELIQAKGAGFGLQLIDSLIEQLNAQMQIETCDGTKFTIKIPLDESK
ncbi:MAG TPA: hypothetical protein DD381_10590 [Lentisphaeria bacterium]|nr:MAG: hypothetical protein A2X47_02080 [Lentisphaerae bacterium GWF2_38_69]HBM16774.1 hypothetical protein [Lentisphaeria bacterium]